MYTVLGRRGLILLNTLPNNDQISSTPTLEIQPLIEVRNLKKYFKRSASVLEKVLTKQKDSLVCAVDDVSFSIYPGETLGLVGESGCGKSTLGRTILNLHEKTDGQIIFKGKDISDMSNKTTKEYRKHAQIIFQNPYGSLNPRMTVFEILKIAIECRGVSDPYVQQQEIFDLIERVGLTKRQLDQYPHQFSGGQRQRIGIARALAMKPEFIVADEPVSALDVSVQAQILNLMDELKQELNLTYLFIAHDLSVVYHVSDRVAVMYLGQMVEMAETKELFNNPKHPYTKALLSSIPAVYKDEKKERIILEGNVPSPINQTVGCVFKDRCFNKKGPICDLVRPEWQLIDGHGVACHLYTEETINE